MKLAFKLFILFCCGCYLAKQATGVGPFYSLRVNSLFIIGAICFAYFIIRNFVDTWWMRAIVGSYCLFELYPFLPDRILLKHPSDNPTVYVCTWFTDYIIGLSIILIISIIVKIPHELKKV